MAINLYSKIEVRPSPSGRIEVTADIPLHLVGDADKGSLVGENPELLEPLRLAARATLAHLGRGDLGVLGDATCHIAIGAGLGASARPPGAATAALARSTGVGHGRP